MKRLIIPIGIFGAIILLLAGGYLILTQTQNSQMELYKNTTGESAVVVNETEKSSFAIEVFEQELNLTSLPNFIVGEQFKYRDVSLVQGTSIITLSTIRVERIEKLNGVEHFVLSTIDERFTKDDPKTGRIIYDNSSARSVIYNYINKNTGKITKTVIKNANAEVVLNEDASSSYEGWIYSPWMLKLKKGLKWESYINMSVGGHMISGPKSYHVVDIEKMNGKNCFKVELVSKVYNPATNVQEINMRSTIWVDIEKRVLVKKVKYIDNLKIDEIELIEHSS